jgi:hypothetical protein
LSQITSYLGITYLAIKGSEFCLKLGCADILPLGIGMQVSICTLILVLYYLIWVLHLNTSKWVYFFFKGDGSQNIYLMLGCQAWPTSHGRMLTFVQRFSCFCSHVHKCILSTLNIIEYMHFCADIEYLLLQYLITD